MSDVPSADNGSVWTPVHARQMQVSTGMYLDMYINPTNSPWYFPPKDGSRLETFRRNLAQALDAADEYIWLYTEIMRDEGLLNKSVESVTDEGDDIFR